MADDPSRPDPDPIGGADRPDDADRPGRPAPAADATPVTVRPDPDDEPTPRERLAALVEDRLDIPMALLAVVWAALVAYELVAPSDVRGDLAWIANAIWGIFVVEFVAKLVVSGHPLRFLRRHWPSLIFLALPALRMLRVLRAVRALRVLPAARVVGSSYRAIGTARTLLGGRLAFLVVASAVAIVAGGQLLYLTEGAGGVAGDPTAGLADSLWWSANLAITGNLVFEPATAPGRLLGVALGGFAIVVVASVAAALGAFFIESRAERASAEDAAVA